MINAMAAQRQEAFSQKSVLIVEDEVLVALDMSAALEDAGLRVIGPAHNVAEALKILQLIRPDAAFLDFNLGRGETSEPIARTLREMGIPITLVTANAREHVPFVAENDMFLSKPIREHALVGVARNLGLL